MENDERLTKLEVSVGVLDTKMDASSKKLDNMEVLLQNQTAILSKFLLFEEKHNNTEAALKELKEDYSKTKIELLSAITSFKSVVFAGAIFTSTIVGMGLYIYNDKIDMLNKHEQILLGK